ncbi:hypothetical protein HanXRQr2_Chr07g0305071 [Helianthus annuus]|uniref:Uncharacterized protein n=1 Tax=Helianthus annuus TaxID=4232 RepID=A0A9K3IMG3_HELAN|nr:hypothetical protein HanXRQr2_Chr07g0305071 [Helianthus annuus]
MPHFLLFQVFLFRVWTDTMKTTSIMSAQTQDHCLSECRQTYQLKYMCFSFVMGVEVHI